MTKLMQSHLHLTSLGTSRQDQDILTCYQLFASVCVVTVDLSVLTVLKS